MRRLVIAAVGPPECFQRSSTPSLLKASARVWIGHRQGCVLLYRVFAYPAAGSPVPAATLPPLATSVWQACASADDGRVDLPG